MTHHDLPLRRFESLVTARPHQVQLNELPAP